MAIRNVNAGHANISEVTSYVSDPKIPVLMLPTPVNGNMTYLETLKSMVDHNLIDSTKIYNYTESINICKLASNNLVIKQSATNITNPRELINFSVWNQIRPGTIPSIGTNYSVYGPGFLPHWLADPAVAINSSSVRLYNGNTLAGGYPSFVTTNINGTNNIYKLSYLKSCTNNTCNNLNVVVGGDGEQTYTEGTFYTYPTNKVGYARCFSPVVCPVKTSVKLSDSSCKLSY